MEIQASPKLDLDNPTWGALFLTLRSTFESTRTQVPFFAQNHSIFLSIRTQVPLFAKNHSIFLSTRTQVPLMCQNRGLIIENPEITDLLSSYCYKPAENSKIAEPRSSKTGQSTPELRHVRPFRPISKRA